MIVRVTSRGQHDNVRVQTNLRKLDPCLYPAVFGALAQHLGLDVEEMRKAAVRSGGREPPDPRYPEITRLIEAARFDWTRWGDQLVRRLDELLADGRLLPMTPANEQLLAELFRDHAAQITARLAGTTNDRREFDRLVRAGLIDPSIAGASYVDIAWKLGRGLDALEARRVAKEQAPSMESIVRQALAVELTPQDRQAIDYAKRRAAIYMRRPAEFATSEANRVLTEAEFAAVRSGVAQGIERREDRKTIARNIDAALKGNATLQNDMDRVVRTELAFAHAHGAYTGLKDAAAEAGEADPEVFKFVSPQSCVDCRRIWGPAANPRRYRLSEIEQREAAGGNFRKPRREWGPVIGPVHPHCTEGPLQFYHPKLISSINEAAEEFADYFRAR